jgi:hypothetical protein
MKLRYVGDLPKVTSRGVGFDQTKPDKYTFMNAAVELLEALSYGATETTQHLHNLSGVYYSDEDLLALLKKHCSDLNAILTERDIKSDAFKEDLIKRASSVKMSVTHGVPTSLIWKSTTDSMLPMRVLIDVLLML